MRTLLSSLFAGSNNVRSTSSMKETASMICSNNMPRRGFGLRSLVAAVAVVCSLAAGQSARATDITFDLTQLPGQTSPQSLTSGGYTLLFTQIGYPVLTGHSGGLRVRSNQYFSISKTAGATDLIFKSYVVNSILNNNSSSFNLTGGTGTSNGNTLTANTTLDYNGSYSLVGSQTATYNPVNFRDANGPGPTEVFLGALTFTAVPEPSTYALGAIATGVMAAIARRRKARKG